MLKQQQALTQKGTLANDVLHVLAALGLEAGGGRGRVKGAQVVLPGRLEQEGGGELGGRAERVEQEREGEGEVGGAEAGRGGALRGAGEQERREEVEEEGEAGGRGERRRHLAAAHQARVHLLQRGLLFQRARVLARQLGERLGVHERTLDVSEDGLNKC